ncbi:MAG: hypothetical protein CMB64_02100 [Euryarchaeota archaeon]|nr:hypothetical protein [Euryarchaeota archaeon]|tara:strand:- start:7360 stop:7776 length:417 start_codon:yes stop_codon:yes gene_type:complete
MEKIYSKINGELLHMVHRLEDMVKSRIDVISDDNFLQLAVMKMEEGKTFRPHRHIYKEVSYDKAIAQESWVVIRGKVKVFMYDIEGSEILAEPILGPGDASITLKGGHTFEILEDDTIAYEYKTGPYEGQALDKEFIN